MAALSVFVTPSSSHLAQEDSLKRQDKHFHVLRAAMSSGIVRFTWHIVACFSNLDTDKQEAS